MLDAEISSGQSANRFAEGDGDRAGLAHRQRVVGHHNGRCRALGVDGVIIRVR